MAETLELLRPEQAFLFEKWPEQPALVEAVKRYAHTGKRLLNDPLRVNEVVAAILNGASLHSVADYFHVGRETVRAAIRHLEESGRLGPARERMADSWRETFTLSQWRIQEALIDGSMPKNVLPALSGIAHDKLTDATHLEPEKPAVKEIDVTPASLAARLRRARAMARGEALPAAATESESAGASAQVPAAESKSSLLPGDDTPAATLEDTPAGGPGCTAAQAEVEGGGDRPFVPPPPHRGDTSENSHS